MIKQPEGGVVVPKLSICIATYNRANFIGETLDSIIPQLSDDVELLIVDGASTDNTEEIVQRYVGHDSRIRYLRLPVKGGVDQDYCKAVELARGTYCWLFTDDDVLKPGAVAAVKAAINEGYVLIVVNAEVRDCVLSEILMPQRMVVSGNKAYKSGEMENLFVDGLTYLSFIGAVVIRRDIWLNRERELYFGTEFVHVGVIFQKPLSGDSLVIAEPYICIRFGNGQWKPRSFEIWMIKWPELVWSFMHISIKAKRSVTSLKPWLNPARLIFERGIGAYSIMHYRKYLSALPVSTLCKLCALLIAIFPEKLLASLLYYYCRLIMPNKMFLYELDSNR
jgi:abequosyltransferase